MNQHAVTGRNTWAAECVRNGVVVWRHEWTNLIPTVGLNKILDAVLKTGLATPAWYIGLVDDGGTFAATDTSSSHAGWTENTEFAAAVRPTFTPGTIAAGAVDNSAAKASFTMNGTGTLQGAFMIDSNTKGGTTGTLYGEGSFTGGDRAYVPADVINITVTCSVVSA